MGPFRERRNSEDKKIILRGMVENCSNDRGNVEEC